MSITDSFHHELRQEARATRQMLALAPENRYGWAPHERSMPLGRLCGHIAEIPSWAKNIVVDDGIDFAEPMGAPFDPKNRAELLEEFDRRLEGFYAQIQGKADAHWFETWTLRRGETLIAEQPRFGVARAWVLNHLYHHRGQLSVYLRLLDVPLPAVYGPTADDSGGFG